MSVCTCKSYPLFPTLVPYGTVPRCPGTVSERSHGEWPSPVGVGMNGHPFLVIGIIWKMVTPYGPMQEVLVCIGEMVRWFRKNAANHLHMERFHKILWRCESSASKVLGCCLYVDPIKNISNISPGDFIAGFSITQVSWSMLFLSWLLTISNISPHNPIRGFLEMGDP